MSFISVISRPYRNWLIKFFENSASMQPIDVIDYFQPEIVNQFSITP